MAATLTAISIAVFAAGIVVGMIVVVGISIRREERDSLRTGQTSLTRLAPTQAASGARRLTGLRTRRPPGGPSHGILLHCS